MIRIISVGSILIALLLGSCEFHQSVDKDLVTGATSRGDGLGCEEVSIQINGKTERRSTFIFGEKVILVFNGINGLKRENDKTYPGLSMHIVKNEKDTVLSEANLLNNLTDGTHLSPLQLQANFVAALPYKNKEKYKAHVKI